MIIQFPPASLRAWLRNIYGDAPLTLESFGYGFGFGDIAAAGQSTATIQILANADFVLTSVEIPEAAGLYVNFSDAGTGEQYFSRPLNCAGNSPVILYPRFITGNSAVFCTAKNNGAGTWSNDVVFNGFHVRGL